MDFMIDDILGDDASKSKPMVCIKELNIEVQITQNILNFEDIFLESKTIFPQDIIPSHGF